MTLIILFTYSFVITFLWRFEIYKFTKFKKTLPSKNDLKLIQALNEGELSENDLKDAGLNLSKTSFKPKQKTLQWLNKLEKQIKLVLKNPDMMLDWKYVHKTNMLLINKPLKIKFERKFDELSQVYLKLIATSEKNDKFHWPEKEARLNCYKNHQSLFEFIQKEKHRLKKL